MEKDWKAENKEYENVKRQSHPATREKRDKKLEFEDSVLVGYDAASLANWFPALRS
jgi:hypothetical protein